MTGSIRRISREEHDDATICEVLRAGWRGPPAECIRENEKRNVAGPHGRLPSLVVCFDATTLWHFDAEEWAPSTASFSTDGRCLRDVCFSNRPFGVKRFQTIHHHSVDVARGLVLLFGIGTKALPSWDSRTRWNNLYRGLTVRRRQVQADMRTHLIHRPARDIIPPLGGARVSSYWI